MLPYSKNHLVRAYLDPFNMTLLESMTFDFEQNIQMILEGLTYCVPTTERCFHLRYKLLTKEFCRNV